MNKYLGIITFVIISIFCCSHFILAQNNESGSFQREPMLVADFFTENIFYKPKAAYKVFLDSITNEGTEEQFLIARNAILPSGKAIRSTNFKYKEKLVHTLEDHGYNGEILKYYYEVNYLDKKKKTFIFIIEIQSENNKFYVARFGID